MPTDELIGKRIQEIRIRRGMTQEQLADRIHISKSSISEWEACKRVPQMKTLRKIAEALGVDVWEIIGFNDVSIDPAQQAREELAEDPDRKALLNLARYGSDRDVKPVAALIDALRATNPDFYDGDDPA